MLLTLPDVFNSCTEDVLLAYLFDLHYNSLQDAGSYNTQTLLPM